jgi:hypothetical protein
MAGGSLADQGRSLESSTGETHHFYERAEEVNNTLTSPGREMGLGMEFALVVGTAVALFLMTFGAGARWEFWWAIAAALYVVGLAGSWR